jgi:WD40 repeat protein
VSKRFGSAQGTLGCCVVLAVLVGLVSGFIFGGRFLSCMWPDAGADPDPGAIVVILEAFGSGGIATLAIGFLAYLLAFSIAVPFEARPFARRFRRDPSCLTIAGCVLSELPTHADDAWLGRCLLAKSLPRSLVRIFVSVPFGAGLPYGVLAGLASVFLLLGSYPFTPEPLDTLRLSSVEFNSDGQFLVSTRFEAPSLPWREAAEEHLGLGLSSDESGGHDKSAAVWKVTGGTKVRSPEGHTRLIYAANWSPDGKIATASWDKTARIWDPATGKCWHTLTGHSAAVFSVAFSPNGKSLATASYDGDVRLWNVDTGAESFVLKGHIQPVYAVQFSADGGRLVTTSFDGTVRVWDAKSGQQAHMFSKTGKPFRSHSLQRNAASFGVFNADGTQVLVTWCNGSMELRDTASGEVLLEMPAPEDKARHIQRTVPAFSPDGTLVATGIDHAVHVSNVRERKLRYALKGHEYDLFLVAFSPDGKRIVSTSVDDTARLWDVSSGKPLHVLQGHKADVWWAAFSPDGKLVATASKDKTARVWRVDDGKLLHVLAE